MVRIEDKNRTGCYRNNEGLEVIQKWLDYETMSELHPLPSDDSALCYSAESGGFFLKGSFNDFCGKLKSGFKDRKMLRRWFYSDTVIRQLHKAGFKLVYYKGTQFDGNTQSAMVIETMKKTRSVSLLTLL